MIRLLFWSALVTIAYTYVGFPLLVLARARLRPRPPQSAPIEPSVTVVMAARNEAAAIGARLDNLAALDYPADRIETIVASDGSDDATVEIVERYGGHGVRVLPLARVGKADALNAAVAEARGDILVFTDANTMFEPGALRALVAPFADPEVGGAAGDQRYLPAGQPGTEAGGERSYWDFDRRAGGGRLEVGAHVGDDLDPEAGHGAVALERELPGHVLVTALHGGEEVLAAGGDRFERALVLEREPADEHVLARE